MKFSRAVLIVSLLLNVALVPFVWNEHLRVDYRQAMGFWLAHVHQPRLVAIGDSLSARMGQFERFDTINLAVGGSRTDQVLPQFAQAQSLHPRHISVMAGTNDAGAPPFDLAAIRTRWKTFAADPSVIITLAPHTRDRALNARLDQINAVVAAEAGAMGRTVLTLHELEGADGLLQPRYSLDGVHWTDAAKDIWEAKLAAAGML